MLFSVFYSMEYGFSKNNRVTIKQIDFGKLFFRDIGHDDRRRNYDGDNTVHEQHENGEL